MSQSLQKLAVGFICAVAATGFAYSGWQNGPWEKVDESAGVEVFRNAEASDVNAFRADVVIKADRDAVMKVVNDHRRAASRDGTDKYKVLHDDGVTTLVYQQISRQVLGTREFTAAGNIFRGADADAPSGFTFAMTKDGPDDPDVDRLARMEGSFVATPLGGNRTRLSYRMLLEPGTWIPNVLIRGALQDAAVDVVDQIRKDVEAAPKN
jgi:hypothetical protein